MALSITFVTLYLTYFAVGIIAVTELIMVKGDPYFSHLNCSSVDPGFTVGFITSAKAASLCSLTAVGLADVVS